MTNPAIGILIGDSGTGPIPLWYGHDVRPEDHENHICACCPASSILAGSCCLIQKCYRKKIVASFRSATERNPSETRFAFQ